MFKKKNLIFVFAFLFLFFMPFKISASNTSYCNYGTERLILPVTIGVKLDAIDRTYPFSVIKEIHDEKTLFVYDKATCNDTLDVSYISESEYFITKSYFYEYNNTRTYVSYIGGGVYSKLDRTPPVISAYISSYVIDVGKQKDLEEFSSMVSAIDDVNGKIIPEIVFDNYSENYNNVGNYNIVFEACDKSNNCSRATINISVVDRIAPVIKGKNEYLSYLSNPININEIINNLSANDNVDGDISNKIVLVSSDFVSSVVGNYYNYYKVIDNSNNESDLFAVKINVIDDIAPVIEGPTTFTSMLSNKLTIDYILSNLVVNDNIDLYAYKNLYIIDDSYSANKDYVGIYSLIVGAYDEAKNEAVPYIVSIEVIDDIAPVIEGTKEYTSYLSSPLSLSRINADLIALDNHDGNLINKIEILEDTYTNNKNTLGVFSITYIVKDNSNNSSQPFVVTIITVDDIKPIIEGVNSYYTLNTKKLNVDNIRIALSANDNIDGDISSNIVLNEDTYSEYYDIVGNYFLTFYVTDSSGNISNDFKVKIIVTQDLDIIDNLNNTHLMFSLEECKTKDEILSLLNINIDNYLSIIPLEDTYSLNYNTQGDYKIVYEVTYLDYTSKNLTLNISTYSSKNDDSDSSNNKATQYDNTQKKETIFTKIISFIKNIWFKIVNFFKSLFH